jgi:hypothetical protein
VAVSAVVTSTAFHAAILNDSESLRQEHPGLERFKIAAERNSKKWYNASAKLLPAASTGFVQIYDPLEKGFVTHPESSEDDPIVDIYGPFVYFLSTVNVDRLEATFRIAPLAADYPSPDATCDIVIVRPDRDPSFTMDDEENRERYVTKLWAIMAGAYKDGSHINLRYSPTGDITSEGDGPAVVEYVRCGGWEWVPVSVITCRRCLFIDDHRMILMRRPMYSVPTEPFSTLRQTGEQFVLLQHLKRQLVLWCMHNR